MYALNRLRGTAKRGEGVTDRNPLAPRVRVGGSRIAPAPRPSEDSDSGGRSPVVPGPGSGAGKPGKGVE